MNTTDTATRTATEIHAAREEIAAAHRNGTCWNDGTSCACADDYRDLAIEERNAGIFPEHNVGDLITTPSGKVGLVIARTATRVVWQDTASNTTGNARPERVRPAGHVSMWTVRSLDGQPNAQWEVAYPLTRRRHDVIRRLASKVLGVPQRLVRVNSVQGVVWDRENTWTSAYFSN